MTIVTVFSKLGAFPAKPRNGLAKAENIHSAPVISISRFDSGLPARLYNYNRLLPLLQLLTRNEIINTTREQCLQEKKAKAAAKAIFKLKSKRKGNLRSKTHPA